MYNYNAPGKNKRSKGLTTVETVISLCLIGILVGVVIPKYKRVAHVAQETALKTGLTNIRTSIKLFKMLNGRNPRSLHEMIEKNVMLPARVGTQPTTGPVFFKQQYLMLQAVDGRGNVIDVFGNPYFYDPINGIVRATSKGYENW